MSSRAFRKALRQREIKVDNQINLENQNEKSEEEEEEEEERSVNVFEMVQ